MKELYNYDIERDYLISIYFSDKDVVNFLIENRANLNQPDKYGVYPLQKAINISSKENISALVKTGKIDKTNHSSFFSNQLLIDIEYYLKINI